MRAMGPLDDAFDDELRARAAALRSEWRADEEAWTLAAFEQFEHGRSMVDVARACMHGGDRVSFLLADATFTGTITGVGDDTARVQLSASRADVVDLHLHAACGVVLRVDERSATDGHRDDAASSFRARALELEDEPHVQVGLATPPLVLTGRLRVARDHLRVVTADGTAVHAARATVSWIRRPPD
jgi:hypothetical protein